MAGKSLGTLTIDLIAKVGGFVQGMDKAERSSQKWRDQVKRMLKRLVLQSLLWVQRRLQQLLALVLLG